jgi:pseudouridine-5'-phosphate glycosidase
MKAQWDLELGGGLVVANPIPAQYALPREAVDRAIEQALADARAQGIAGKAATPFLLARVNALTGGDSLAANIELVLNNARLAAALAAAYASLTR